MRIVAPILALAMAGAIGCGKDDEKDAASGDPIGAPQITPPVERNSPSGFALMLLEEESNNTPEKRIIYEIQRYLNPTASDATGALDRLETIDGRMEELDKRVTGGTPRACLEDHEAESYTLAGDLPGSKSFSLKFQCQENLDGGDGSAKGSQLAFGITETTFYLMERTGGHNNAVLAQAGMDGESTEFWQLSNNDGDAYIHLRAEDGVGMEFVTAGTGVSVFECGAHMRSDDDYVYISAYDATSGSDEAACAEEVTILCLDADDLSETDVSDCEDAGLDDFELESISQADTEDAGADDIITTPITGFTEFIEEAAGVSE